MDTNSAHDTARILIEALPYIQRFSGATAWSTRTSST